MPINKQKKNDNENDKKLNFNGPIRDKRNQKKRN